jgi:O-glycosyl hydrolase
MTEPQAPVAEPPAAVDPGNTDVSEELPLGPEAPLDMPMDPPMQASDPVTCAIVANAQAPLEGDVNVDLSVEFQPIAGFGGISVPAWIPDLTPAQVDTAFGNGPGQLGLSILRVRIPHQRADFARELPTAARAVSLGARVMATPWTPPVEMKSNGALVGGELNVASYGAYAAHLLEFRDFMADNGMPLYAISVQNEPDYEVEYESCFWSPAQLIAWLSTQGPKFGDTKLMAAESVKFDRAMTDPILQDAAAAAQVDIVAGHVYGGGVSDYPLARELGKEVWMTEHYRASDSSSNEWPLALDVGREIHNLMAANFSAYVWWYLRRSYGPLTEDGQVSKVGYQIAQYAKFVRPGFVRVGASAPASADVHVTAYKRAGDEVVVVAVNQSTAAQSIALSVYNGCVQSLSKITTSGTKSLADDGTIELVDGRAALTLDAQSVTTFVSRSAATSSP